MADHSESLTARIERVEALVPEQVASAATDETEAVLVDQWGRHHAVRAVMLVGRDPADGLADVIESKHGFGYRLRLPPTFER